jgi:hypothetical protein
MKPPSYMKEDRKRGVMVINLLHPLLWWHAVKALEFRKILWRFARRKHPEGRILTPWLLFVRCVLFQLRIG